MVEKKLRKIVESTLSKAQREFRMGCNVPGLYVFMKQKTKKTLKKMCSLFDIFRFGKGF